MEEIKYYYSKSEKGFYNSIDHVNLPSDIVQVEKHLIDELLKKEMTGKFVIISDENGYPIAVDPDSLLNAKQIEKIKSKNLINKAKELLSSSDYKVLPDRFNNYNKEAQEAIIKYREELREVVRGNLKEIPELDT